jgi:putative spermidine/putrescine transport system permease protein
MVNSLLLATGLTTEPLRILFTPYAAVIALVQVLLPFMILSVNSVLENLDPHLEEAAQGLGATPYRTLSNVVLPLSRPGLVSGSILVFVLTVSSYETPALLGGEKHKVIAVTIQEQAMLLINWPFGAAISFSLLMALALVSLLYLRATREGNGVK